MRKLWLVLAAVAGVATPPAPALAQSTSVQYDYDALGRVCRARYQGGQTINYRYDANGNRKEMDQKTSGGVTNSADCPMVTASAAPASAARPRTNIPPTVAATLNVTLCATMYASACPVQRVNVLRYAFDWDLNSITVISTAMQSGPGTVAVTSGAQSISVTPPASAPNGTTAQVIYTVSDGVGGTATGYVNITYVNY
jgi:YD repeat-containing protein